MNTNILIIVGSLRKQSINKSAADALLKVLPEGMKAEIADISAIPLYNQDDEASFPGVVAELKNKIKSADGIIIVTPEYNRSIPGVLKNAIDWTSRPYGDSAWKQKPVGMLGVSGGHLGAALAQAHLKVVLSYLDTHMMGQPEMYIGGSGDKIDANGVLTDTDTIEHIKNFLQKFESHIQKVK